jgi:hypothetical protein
MDTTHYNPTFALFFALASCISLLFFMNKTKRSSILLFLLNIVILKLIPLFTIKKRITKQDILASIVLFIMYSSWLLLNNKPVWHEVQLAKLFVENKI